MPFFNGKKVSNSEYRRLKGGGTGVGWKDAFGYNDGSEPPPEQEPEAPSPKKRTRSTKRSEQAKSAAAALTGLDITLPGDEAEENE